MPCILHIESSTTVCSVALSNQSEPIFLKESFEPLQHTIRLAPFVGEAVEFAKQEKLNIDAVAVSCGPGSYTGLRIGVSLAKGICYGLGIPLIAINTLDLLALTIFQQGIGGYICPMIDARRMEVYTAVYDQSLKTIKPIASEIIEPESFSDYLNHQEVWFAGNGAMKCRPVITHPNARFISEELHPRAVNMIKPALDKFEQGVFENTAYFEPFYLKDFIPTVPKNKVLQQI